MSKDQVKRRREHLAILFSVVLLVLVVIPVVQNFHERPRDEFPLSYYPMFTNRRKETTRLIHPIGIKHDGTSLNLHYGLVSNGGMNQARRQLIKLVDENKAAELCDRIARKIRDMHQGDLTDVVQVQIVDDQIEIDKFFQGNRKPKKRKILARSDTNRGAH